MYICPVYPALADWLASYVSTDLASGLATYLPTIWSHAETKPCMHEKQTMLYCMWFCMAMPARSAGALIS